MLQQMCLLIRSTVVVARFVSCLVCLSGLMNPKGHILSVLLGFHVVSEAPPREKQ